MTGEESHRRTLNASLHQNGRHVLESGASELGLGCLTVSGLIFYVLSLKLMNAQGDAASSLNKLYWNCHWTKATSSV